MTHESAILRFGVFEADLEAGELRRNGLKVKLQEQPFQILLMLLERPGDVVTRDELRGRLWPDGTFVDFDHSLNASMNKLRDALADAASNPRFIETVPRKGYRFIAPIDRRERPSRPEAARPIREPRRKLIVIAAGALAAALLGIAGAAIWRTTGAREMPPEVIPLTSDRGVETQPSLSPDGNYVAYTGIPHGGKADIYVKQIGSDTVRRLTSAPAPSVSPKWSPDGRHIAFVRIARNGSSPEAAVLTVPALGGQERIVSALQITTESGKPVDVLVDWLGDSEHIIVPDQAGTEHGAALFVINARTGVRRQLTTPPTGGRGDRDPAVSPDSRRVAFTRFTDGVSSEIRILGLDEELRSAGEPRLLNTPAGSRTPTWTPDGRAILFGSGPQHRKRLWRVPVDTAAQPEVLPFASEGYLGLAASLSASGRLVYSTLRTDVEIYRTQLSKGGHATGNNSFLSSTFLEHLPEYSPDGKRIAFVSNRSGAQEIWISESDGSGAHQLTTFRGVPEATFPRWSPDGSSLVFAGDKSLYSLAVNGGRPILLAKDSGAGDWSRDGKWIYVSSDRTGRSEIWKMPAEPGAPGSHAVQITRNGGGVPRVSEDGEFIYYAKGNAPADIWRVPAGGGDETLVLENVSTNGAFAVTRNGMYFIPQPRVNEPTSIVFQDLRTGRRRIVAPVDGAPLWGLTVSPDGLSILHVQLNAPEGDLMLVENFR